MLYAVFTVLVLIHIIFLLFTFAISYSYFCCFKLHSVDRLSKHFLSIQSIKPFDATFQYSVYYCTLPSYLYWNTKIQTCFHLTFGSLLYTGPNSGPSTSKNIVLRFTFSSWFRLGTEFGLFSLGGRYCSCSKQSFKFHCVLCVCVCVCD
jgi:hypothetical protein